MDNIVYNLKKKNHYRREPIQHRPNFGVAIISLVLYFYLQKRLKTKNSFSSQAIFSECIIFQRALPQCTYMYICFINFSNLKSIYFLYCKTREIRAMFKFLSSRETYNIYAICAWAYTFTCISMNLCIQCMGNRPIPGRR